MNRTFSFRENKIKSCRKNTYESRDKHLTQVSIKHFSRPENINSGYKLNLRFLFIFYIIINNEKSNWQKNHII